MTRRLTPVQKAYGRGWRWADAGKDLDRADAAGHTDSDPWTDGFLDRHAGRPFGHLLTCIDRDRHETCWTEEELSP